MLAAEDHRLEQNWRPPAAKIVVHPEKHRAHPHLADFVLGHLAIGRLEPARPFHEIAAGNRRPPVEDVVVEHHASRKYMSACHILTCSPLAVMTPKPPCAGDASLPSGRIPQRMTMRSVRSANRTYSASRTSQAIITARPPDS